MPTPLEITNEFLNWFWLHRQNHFTAGRDGLDWALPLYDARSRLEALAERGRGEFPAFAIWGPSQAGKSTLLSGIIDAKAEDDGTGSALHWGGVPIRFAGDASVNSFNPYTGGMDASGCVTRFHLGEPKHKNFPVRLKLARFAELRMALAAGYLDECVCVDASGEKIVWSEKTINDRFSTLFKNSQRDGLQASRETAEEIHRLVEIIRKLIAGGRDRYINLRKALDVLERQWVQQTALGAPASLKRWISAVLWDGNRVIESFAEKIAAWMSEERNRFLQGKNVYCSSVLAAKLVNIAAYQNMLEGQDDFKDLHQKIRYVESEDGDILMDCESGALAKGAGMAFCRTPLDFGFLQGLVWEIVVHLNRQNISENDTGFISFMERSDLLDFPGVAVAQKGENALDLTAQRDFTAEMLTKVLKRGKTASIVYRYAESLGIDGMTLLNRALTPVSSPSQLVSGVSAWLTAAKSDYKHGEKAPLPLNIAVSRSSKIFNDYWQNMKAEVVGASLTEHIAALGWVSNPGTLHHFLSLTYHLEGKFIRGREGEVRYNRDPHFFDTAAPVIMGEYEKARRFDSEESRRSFEAMYKEPDGGVDFFFTTLAAQAGTTRGQRDTFVTKRLHTLVETLFNHAEPEVPRTDSGDAKREREADFDKFERQIVSILSGGNVQDAHKLYFLLKTLFYVDVDTLPAFSRTAHGTEKEDLSNYIGEVVGQWKNTATANAAILSREFSQISPALIVRIIAYCAEHVVHEQFVSWAQTIGLPHMDVSLQLQLRRHTAMWLANQLPLRKAADLAHLPETLRDQSPPEGAVVQWISVAKLLVNLNAVRASALSLRAEKEKPGDDVLRAIFLRLKEVAETH